MAQTIEPLMALVRARFPKADNFTDQVSLTLPEGTIHYVEFDHGEGDERDFYYFLTSPSGVTLLEDALDALVKVQNLIERRKSFWQRITEGSLSDLVASLIALTVTFGFVLHTAVKGTPDQSLLAIFTLVLGYYFGKKTN